MDRTERLAPLVTGIALAIPTLIAHYLPMSDLPLHEGVVGILRHYGDPAYFDDGLYRLNLGHANQLFHMLALGLSFVVGTTWAVKLVIAATQVAIMLAGAHLADHVGRSRWGVVLCAPLVLGFTYYWGLVANLLGFAGFLYALPLMDRVSIAPTPGKVLKLCGLLTLLFLAHESVFVFAVGFTTLLALAHPFSVRQTSLRFVPFVFGVALFTGYFFWTRKFFTRGQIPLPTSWPPMLDKLRFVPADLFGSHDELTRVLLCLLGICGILLLAMARLRSNEARETSGPSRLARVQSWVRHYRFEMFGVALLAAFLASPLTWDGATLVHARFLNPAWALLAIMAAPRETPSLLPKLAIAGLPVGILLLSWPQFVDADRTYRSLNVLIAQIPKNSSVALTALDRPVYRTRVYSAAPGPARLVADRGGRMSLSLVNSPISPVQITPMYRWEEYDQRVFMGSSRAMKPRSDLDRFGWIIAQSRDPAVRKAIPLAFKPDAELVDEQGEWVLLRSTHPQIPLKSVEPPGTASDETVSSRVYSILKARYEEEQRGLRDTP